MKRGLVPLFLAVLAPAVLAQDQGIFGNAFSLIFGSVSGSPANDMVLKVGLWLALTMVLFQGAQKIFKTKDANGQEIGSKKLSIIFALIISTIAVRFMPPFISEGLGAMTWIAALILLPYTLVSFVTDNKWTKVIATGIFVILIWALFSSYGAPFVFPYIRGNNFLSDLFYMMTPQAWMIPVMAIGTILIIFFIVSAKGAPSPGGGGSSASSGLFGKALGGLGKAIAAPFKAVGHGLSGLGKGIGYAWLGLGKGVGAAAHGTGRLAGGAIGGIGKGIGAAAPYVGKGIGAAAGGIAHGIGAGAKGAGQLGGAALSKGGKGLLNWWKNRPKKTPRSTTSRTGPNIIPGSSGQNAPRQHVPTLPSQGYPPDQQQPLKPKIFQRMANIFKKQPKISPVSPVAPEEETFQKIPSFQKPALKLPESKSFQEEFGEHGINPQQLVRNPMTMREMGKIKRKIAEHKVALDKIKRQAGGTPSSGSRDARLFEKHRKLVNVYSKMKGRAGKR